MARTKEGFVVCSVGGKTVAVASGELGRHFNGMITLNSTGELLFRMLQKGAEPEELYDALQKEYGVEREVAVRDADRFLKSLEKAGVLEE